MNRPSLNRQENLSPKTRLAEVLAMFIINKKNWLSHYDFASELWNLNSHKRIGDLKSLGVRFEEKSFSFVNRFDRKSSMKKFRLNMPVKKAMKIFNQINGEI